MSPRPTDDPQVQLREAARMDAATNAVKTGAEALKSQLAADRKFMFEDRGAIKDKQGDPIKGANLADSFNKMAKEIFDQGLKDMDKAISKLDTGRNANLTDADRKLLERLGSTLDDCAKGAEKEDLGKVSRDIDQAATQAREDAKSAIDARASDQKIIEQADARNAANARAETLENANRVAQEASKLLEQMEKTSITVVERQEFGPPNPEKRRDPRSKLFMGASANKVAGTKADDPFHWMHLLGRAEGGKDKVPNVAAGSKASNQDMQLIEDKARDISDLSRAIDKGMRIEAEITCKHNAVKYEDDVKKREGYELRFQVWASDKNARPNPKDKPIVDATLNMQSQVRDENVKAVFNELKNLREAVKNGDSPDEAVKNLRDLIEKRNELQKADDLKDEQERIKRLQAENDLEDKS